MLLLEWFYILVPFIKTLTADDKYSHHNKKKLLPLIHMILFQTPKTFPRFSIAFVKSKSNSEYFEKKDESHSLSITKIIDSKEVST